MFTGLSSESAQHFMDHGYVAVPDFWDAREVAAMQAELDRLKRDGLLRNVATDGDGKSRSNTIANLQLCPMYNKSDFYRAMPFAPKVLDTISRLIGDPFIQQLDQVFLKPGRHGAGTSWHQDNSYFLISNPMKGVALWTAVHAATIANGTMNVIPDSAHEVLEHSRDPYSDHHIRCYPDESRAVPVELPAGGALFFAYGTPHCTRANTTDHERAGMAMHFLHADYAHKELIDPARTTRPYLTGPQATGGLREYGVTVAGTWDQQVERMLGKQ